MIEAIKQKLERNKEFAVVEVIEKLEKELHITEYLLADKKKEYEELKARIEKMKSEINCPLIGKCGMIERS